MAFSFLYLIIGICGLAICILLAVYLYKQQRIRRLTDSRHDHYRSRRS